MSAQPKPDLDPRDELARRENVDLPPAGAEPAFLPHPLLDRLVDVVLELGAELWIERDRRRVLEQLLAERGIVRTADLEAHRDTPEQRAERLRDRDAFVRRLYGSLKSL